MPIYHAPKDYVGEYREVYGTAYTSARLPRWHQEQLIRNVALMYSYGNNRHSYRLTFGATLVVAPVFTWLTIIAAIGAVDAYTRWGIAGHIVLMVVLFAITTCVVTIGAKTGRALYQDARVRFARIDTSEFVVVNIEVDERWKALNIAWRHFVTKDTTLCGEPIAKLTLKHALMSDDTFSCIVEPIIDHYYKSSDDHYTKLIDMERLEMEETKPYKKLKKRVMAMTEKTATDIVKGAARRQQAVNAQKAMMLEEHTDEIAGLVSQADYFLKQDPIIP